MQPTLEAPPTADPSSRASQLALAFTRERRHHTVVHELIQQRAWASAAAANGAERTHIRGVLVSPALLLAHLLKLRDVRVTPWVVVVAESVAA